MVYRSLLLLAFILSPALIPATQTTQSNIVLDQLRAAALATAQNSRIAVVTSERASLVPVGGDGTGYVEVSAGEKFVIIEDGHWIQSEHGGAHRWMTVLTEQGHPAFASFRDVARVIEVVSPETMGIATSGTDDGEGTVAGGIVELVFAVQSRYFDRGSWFYSDNRLLLIPVTREFSYREASEQRSQYAWQWQRQARDAARGAQTNVVHPEDIIHIDLTVDFSRGSGAAAAFPFEVLFEDFTGTGEPQFGVRNRSITVTALTPYVNETLETYWFRYNGSEVRRIVRNVDRTVTPRGRIDYTHVGERDSNGALRTIRSYASQQMRWDQRAHIDKSVRTLNGGRFVWIPSRSRLTEIVPAAPYTELRVQPRHDADIRDWIARAERIHPLEVHVSPTNEVWLKVDEPRGARGWIREADVRWQ